MDKDRIIQLVEQAVEISHGRYQKFYEIVGPIPQIQIDEALDTWVSYVEDHKESLKSGLLHTSTIIADAKRYLDQYEEGTIKFGNSLEKLNIFYPELWQFGEFHLIAGKLVCQEFIVWLKSLAVIETDDIHELTNLELARRLIDLAQKKARIEFDTWVEGYLSQKLKHRGRLKSLDILRKKRVELSDWYLKHKEPAVFFDVANVDESTLLGSWRTEFADHKQGVQTFIPGNPIYWLILLTGRYKTSYCIDHLDAMLSDKLETWQKKKYQGIAFGAKLAIKLLSNTTHIPQRAVLDALEQANANDWPQGGKDRGMSLPIEQQSRLAAELVETYQELAAPSTDQLEYLNKVVEQFFEQNHSTPPSQPAAKDEQEVLSFESMFIDQSGGKTCIALCEGVGIPNKVAKEKADSKKNRYKNRFAVVWQILKDNRLVHSDLPDQKACEAIAQRFGTSIGKNTWSDWSISKDSPQAQTIYRETIRYLPK